MVSHMKNHTVSHEHLGATDIDLDYKFAFNAYNISLLGQYNFYQTKNFKIFLATGLRFYANFLFTKYSDIWRESSYNNYRPLSTGKIMALNTRQSWIYNNAKSSIVLLLYSNLPV